MSDDQQKQNNHAQNDSANKQQKQEQSVSISKEGEPISVPAESARNPEVKFSESAPRVEDKDVEKYVQVETDEPEIHPDLKKAGLQAVDTTSLDSRHRVELPISDEKVLEGLDQPVSSSWRWLAEFAIYLLKRAHLSLKKVHGKVIRVVQR